MRAARSLGYHLHSEGIRPAAYHNPNQGAQSLMVDKNDPLFREVNEELRREQVAKLWEKYGVYVIAAASLIVAFVGGFKFWESRQHSLAEAGGAQYEAAVQLESKGKTDDAAKAFQAIAEGGPAGYAALAELTLAGAQLKDGRPKDALAAFEKLAAAPNADPLLASFASLQAASLRLGEADYAEMQNRLNPLIGDQGAWRYNARELLGMAAISAGKLDEARTTLTPLLADPLVPETTRERVQRLMAEITTTELGKSQAPTAEGAAAPAPETKQETK